MAPAQTSAAAIPNNLGSSLARSAQTTNATKLTHATVHATAGMCNRNRLRRHRTLPDGADRHFGTRALEELASPEFGSFQAAARASLPRERQRTSTGSSWKWPERPCPQNGASTPRQVTGTIDGWLMTMAPSTCRLSTRSSRTTTLRSSRHQDGPQSTSGGHVRSISIMQSAGHSNPLPPARTRHVVDVEWESRHETTSVGSRSC